MEHPVIVESSFSVPIDAPYESIDLPAWAFGLAEQDYQGCSPAHVAAGFTRSPDGRRMSINVEIIGGSLMVQHYVEDLADRHHLRLISASDVFTPNGRTTIEVLWELSVGQAGDGRCEFTNSVRSRATDEFLEFLARQGFRSTSSAPGVSRRPSRTTARRRRGSPRASRAPRAATRRRRSGRPSMAERAYQPCSTALLLVDPYNDFLSEGGKLWPLVEEIAGEVGLLANLRAIVGAVRAAGLQVVIVPHRRWQAGDYQDWQHPNPTQQRLMTSRAFARGEWGGEWHPDFAPQPGDIVVKEHWGQSGFANTDLDLRLKQRGITQVVVVGLLANTCIESTARFAMELGYHVTLVRDATAAFSRAMMHAAHGLNGPTFAHAILTTAELLAALPPPPDRSHGGAAP